ncbi:hypothetical protein BJV77DRAFT_313497 [Russula vinacea]|nr:hypothetical protein BJV77DRAFT_313497 [Russula vinacea]
MELIQRRHRVSSQDTEQTLKSTINHFPEELLVEIFDLHPSRQHDVIHANNNQWWLEWFKLIHVCKRWRTVMFAWSSRLDLCFLLKPKMGGNMKTILSRRYFPPSPIVIDYNCQRDDVKSKDMGRMLAALKRPDRIREIRLSGTAAILDKFFDAINFLSRTGDSRTWLRSLQSLHRTDNPNHIPRGTMSES